MNFIGFLKAQKDPYFQETKAYEMMCPFCSKDQMYILEHMDSKQLARCLNCSWQGDFIAYLMCRYLLTDDQACMMAKGVPMPKQEISDSQRKEAMDRLERNAEEIAAFKNVIEEIKKIQG